MQSEYVDIDNGFFFGMHALGAVGDVMYPNAREGLLYWYNQGVKVFEVDISPTDDGKYVAYHDFNKDGFLKHGIQNVPGYCTEQWFLGQRLYTEQTKSGLTPISLDGILDFLIKERDGVLMVDPKPTDADSNARLWRYLNDYITTNDIDGRRIVYEIYDENMLRGTQTIKSDIRLQFCIYDAVEIGESYNIRKRPFMEIVDWMEKNNIKVVSFPWQVAVEKLEELKYLKDKGYVVFSRTRNDIFSELLIKSGINVNLVDYVCTEQQREDLKEYKKNYMLQYANAVNEIFK